jgi:hypothetical protein
MPKKSKSELYKELARSGGFNSRTLEIYYYKLKEKRRRIKNYAY